MQAAKSSKSADYAGKILEVANAPGEKIYPGEIAKALELGGMCEGAPGLRGAEGDQAFYGAYFRDLDGNKLEAATFPLPEAT